MVQYSAEDAREWHLRAADATEQGTVFAVLGGERHRVFIVPRLECPADSVHHSSAGSSALPQHPPSMSAAQPEQRHPAHEQPLDAAKPSNEQGGEDIIILCSEAKLIYPS
ncbi:hypothetical protein LDFHOB_09570 [Candidatus Electronema aureum]